MTAAMHTKAPQISSALKSEARSRMSAPFSHFGYSNTRIHSVPRKDAEAIQLAALNLRLEERHSGTQSRVDFSDANH